MGIEDKNIVAIELSSSKIIGMVGKKQSDGNLQILAMAQEPATAFMLNGMVNNMEKTTQSIKQIIEKLQTTLKRRIEEVYISINGQGMYSVRNTVIKSNKEADTISQNLIYEMLDDNLLSAPADKQILSVVTQNYKVGTQILTDAVGILGDLVEGNFLNITARPALTENIRNCFKTAKIKIADEFVAPLILGSSYLSDAERRSGCVLVDMGASLTTVAVFYKNILRHLAVIPLGCTNITRDITSLQIEEEEAELIKIEKGSAYTSYDEISSTGDQDYLLKDGRLLKEKTISEIVEARVQEIIFNVKKQIDTSELSKEQLLAGLILMGGGANLKNIEKAFQVHIGFEKIRIAHEPQMKIIMSKGLSVNIKEGVYNTVIALINAGKTECLGAALESKRELDLFTEYDNDVVEVVTGRQPSHNTRESATNQAAPESTKKATEPTSTNSDPNPVQETKQKKESKLKNLWNRWLQKSSPLFEEED